MNARKLVLTAAVSALAIADQAQAEFDFSSKTIEWVIPFSETGGSAK